MNKEVRSFTQLQIKIPKQLSRDLDKRLIQMDKSMSKADLILSYAQMGVKVETLKPNV